MRTRRAIPDKTFALSRCVTARAVILSVWLASMIPAHGQREVDPAQVTEKKKAEKAETKQQERVAQNSDVTIAGATAFKEDELRSQLKEQITTISELGLTAARGDDAAFLLELFYRKHGYEKANVSYTIDGSRLRLDIDEGVRVTVGEIAFVGNEHIPHEKLFEFVIGPTRERYGKTEKSLPFVKNDLQEGVELVRRLYIAEGYLHVIVQEPNYSFVPEGAQVNLTIAIVEGRQYEFGPLRFSGTPVFAAEELQRELADILQEPYTDRRLADIPRRLQAYYKQHGYYDVKVDATGNPGGASGGRVPVVVTIAPGPIYYFDGSTVTGLKRLRPSYVTKRFQKLSGKQYNPKVVDEKFREMMKTGLFSVLQIKPVQVDGDRLRMDITAEEAKSKEFGFSLGYGSFAGLIVGASYRDRNLFGYGRPVTTSAEYSSRGYKGEIAYEDPYLFETEIHLKTRLSALTYDFDGYSKREFGLRFDLERELTKQYKLGGVFSARNVDITSASIDPIFLGRTSYQVNSIGFTQTLDLRSSPLAAPRGLVVDNTFDYAGGAFGSQIDFVRRTLRATYYIPFSRDDKIVKINPTGSEGAESSWERWFRRTMLAVGARSGVIQGVSGSSIPIDERFFNGGANSVRSFAERDLGPKDRGNPIGGEYFSVFNVEYTFPVYGELNLALFVDAGNLLPRAEDVGFDNLRYGVGLGLRYQLPIGPLRIDYGVNPNRRPGEAFGAFHFSFGFAF